MSVVLICVGSALMQLSDFVNIYVRSGFDIEKTLLCMKYKRRLELFRLYCGDYRIRSDRVQYKSTAPMSKEFSAIDFTAEEAYNCCSNAADEICLLDTAVHDYFAHYDEIDILDEVVNLDVYENEEETPVYYNKSISNVVEGVSFTVTGTTKKYCERFSINFVIENAARDIALHINPRLPQNYIVRNSKVNNVWGKEEVTSALPFTLKRGSSFSIQVLFTITCCMISVNGYHFCEFLHRLPYDNIQTIEIKGEVDNIIVERKKVKEYPDRSNRPVPKPIVLAVPPEDDEPTDDDFSDNLDSSHVRTSHIPREWRRITIAERNTLVLHRDVSDELALPFYGSITSSAFDLGSVLKIEGRIKLLPQAFYINLQTGCDVWPHPVIAMHLNIRFTKQQAGVIGRSTIIRNSWKNGAWGVEERSDIDTEFRPGKTFSLCIVHAERSFEIFVNHRLVTEYKFRIPVDTIDTIYIQGDIKLWDVFMAKELSFTSFKRTSEWKKISSLRRSIHAMLDPHKDAARKSKLQNAVKKTQNR